MSALSTKARILAAAQILMQQRGTQAVSFRHISDAVGVCKATVVHHFSNKEKLVEAVLAHHRHRLLERLDKITTTQLSASDQLMLVLEIFRGSTGQGPLLQPCLSGILGAEPESVSIGALTIVQEFCESVEERLSDILRQGWDEGTFDFPGSVNETAALVFAFLVGSAMYARGDNGHQRWVDVSKQLMTMLGANRPCVAAC